MLKEYDSFIRDDLDIKFETKEPIVGILIPNFNHGKFIENAIESVIEQEYKNKIIIIIDDCSTDNSVKLIKQLFYKIKKEVSNHNGDSLYIGHISGTPTILIALKENGKQANARNIGIATTFNYCDYYCQLDADDEFLPDKLSTMIEVINTDPTNIGLVYNDVIIQNKITGVTTHEFREPYSYDRLMSEDIICNQPLINKKVLEEIGLYDKDITPTEDWDLFLRIAQNFMCIHIPKPLQIYNVVESSCTFTVNKERWNWCWNRIREKLQQRHSQ